MKLTNTLTGRDCTKYVLGFLEGLITKDEFELLCCLPSKKTSKI